MMVRDVALALSGGGYRAAYFHLGVLQKLHELDLLSRVAVISSVSGGSIIAGSYAQSLVNGGSFATFLSRTQEFLCKKTLDWPTLVAEVIQQSSGSLEGQLVPLFTRPGGALTRLSDLKESAWPRFLFNATLVHSGRGWRFVSGGTAEEWELGQTHAAAYSRIVDCYRCDVTLAKAVAASAAYPLFSSVTIDRSLISEPPPAEPRNFPDLPDPVCLSDGGVMDNTGLTSIIAGHEPPGWEKNYYLIGSDAGSIVNPLDHPPKGRIRKVHYLLRQFEITGHHNNRMTVALILKVHRTQLKSKKGMAMLRFDEAVPERREVSKAVADLVGVKTRLKFPGSDLAHGLMEHGANLLWARVSEYTDLLPEDREMPAIQKRSHRDEN